jgi:hypothetical protein
MKKYDIQDFSVAAAYKAFPEEMRSKLLALRQMVFETASGLDEVGPIEETLKWGVPSYLTPVSKSGTTIRLAPAKEQDCYGLYVHCQTRLIEEFKQTYPDSFNYSGTRALLFKLEEPVPEQELREFIAAALTYHRRKVPVG